MARRGFVGPLGDDLPSIFPIVAGVLLFIGTILYANNLVDQKNHELEARQAGLGLSYIVTQTGLIDDPDTFASSTCEQNLKKYALSNRVSFLVTVKRFCQKLEFFSADAPGASGREFLSPLYLERTPVRPPAGRDELLQGHTFAFCTNAENPPATGLVDVPDSAVVFSYPVAVPCPQNNLPTRGLGMVNVITWKK